MEQFIKGKRRARLLGKYAGDKNIDVETDWGHEFLATVMTSINPQTGKLCEIKPGHCAAIHEYRFCPGSNNGWISPDGKSDKAYQTKQTAFDQLGDVMICRDCNDKYYPAEKASRSTLDNPQILEAITAFETRHGKVGFSTDKGKADFLLFVYLEGIKLGKLADTAGRQGLTTKFSKDTEAKVRITGLQFLASVHDMAKAVRDSDDAYILENLTWFKEIAKACSEAKSRLRKAETA